MEFSYNALQLVREFVSRQDYIAVYTGLVGLWLLWLAYRGTQLGSTKGFGWRAPDAYGAAAVEVGRAWLAIGSALIAAGIGLWVTS